MSGGWPTSSGGIPQGGRTPGLGMDPPDPYVEWLLEGFAFLAARSSSSSMEFRFIQSLLATVYPHFLTPLPAMAMVRLSRTGAGRHARRVMDSGHAAARMLARGETTLRLHDCRRGLPVPDSILDTATSPGTARRQGCQDPASKAAIGLRLQALGD
jgi:type VI protein secretion system component VasA